MEIKKGQSITFLDERGGFNVNGIIKAVFKNHIRVEFKGENAKKVFYDLITECVTTYQKDVINQGIKRGLISIK